MDNGNPWEIFVENNENKTPELPTQNPMAVKVKIIVIL